MTRRGDRTPAMVVRMRAAHPARPSRKRAKEKPSEQIAAAVD
ncbi:hypothetical protein [Actinopolymorpha alba]|nr:hypothetical protein [Actinopolymorpha alba]